MAAFFRETAFGATVRLLSRNKLLAHPEDQPGWNYVKSGGSVHSDDTRVGTDEPKVEPKDEKTKLEVITWYGENDKSNPNNWSTPVKVYATALLGLYTTSVYICSAIYTPGLSLLMEDLNAGVYTATLGLTLFVMGYGISPLVLTPITMMPHIGKLYPYLISFFLFIAFTIGSAAVKNAAGFLVLRFLAGLAGSPAISTVGASLNDIWPQNIVARCIAVWGSSASLGPILGPLIGAAAIERFGTWRAPLYLNACVASFTLVLLFFTMPETGHAVILEQRRKRIERVTGCKDVTTEWEQTGFQISVWSTIVTACRISYDFTVLYVNSLIAIGYLILYSWFETIPVVFTQYGFTPVQQGLVYLFPGVAIGLGLAGYLLWLIYVMEPRARREGMSPDAWMIIMKIAVVSMPVSLFWFAWTANRTHWAVPAVAMMPFGWAIFYYFMAGLNTLTVTFYPHLLSIYALNAVFRSVFAAIGPIYAHPAIQNIGVAWFTTILGVASLFMVPLPWILQRYGKPIRARSKWAVPDNDAKEAAPITA